MIDRRIFSIAVVVCCLLAMVSLSASLESTVETSPGKAIELDFASLPLSVGQASELKQSYHSGSSSEDQEAASASRSTEPESEAERSGGTSEAERSGETSENERSGEADKNELAGGDRMADPDQGLLAKLAALLSALGSSWLWLVVVVGVLLSVTQRNRILAWVKRHLDRRLSTADDPAPGPEEDRPFHPPENVVERSWLELLSWADVEPDPSATPRETAAELVGAGLDRRAVGELTELFEESRYGDEPVTATRADRALRCLRRCRRQEGTAE
ncbi:DUF4129 domain-containing protein [Halobellus ordinarius]|uniref:DUF4129 domain-containing protein n=1 Tax=Halobellus ordinarius TaxID=3075120 RepID=UPI0028809D60|nr:DUF4129 domain-containing protein [Halobellus sp. ZY16]